MRVSEGAWERVATGRVRVSGWDHLRIFEMRVKVRESSTCERARGESVVLKSACDMSDWEGAKECMRESLGVICLGVHERARGRARGSECA